MNLSFGAQSTMPPAAKRYASTSYRAVLLLVKAPQADLRVVMEPVRTDGVLQVTALDEEGRPLARASVRADGAVAAESGTTGADGRLLLRDVERGYVHLAVSPAAGSVSPDTPVPHVEVVDVNEKSDVIVRLRPGHTIDGVVRGPDGLPRAGVPIHGGHPPGRPGQPVASDEEGRFRIVVRDEEGWSVTAVWTDPDGVYYLARAGTPRGVGEVVLQLARGER